jgi:hypothetical protein
MFVSEQLPDFPFFFSLLLVFLSDILSIYLKRSTPTNVSILLILDLKTRLFSPLFRPKIYEHSDFILLSGVRKFYVPPAYLSATYMCVLFHLGCVCNMLGFSYYVATI